MQADGTITGYTGKCELGQGMFTAQVQLVAEELSVPVDRVKLVQCDTDATPDQGTTSGSQSTPTNFNEESLALACATARQAQDERGQAERLGIKPGQVVQELGYDTDCDEQLRQAITAVEGVEAVDEDFNALLELGFSTSIRREWAWRVSRGESLKNLEAFAHLIDDDQRLREEH